MEGRAVDEHEILDNDDIGMGPPIPYGPEDASSAFGDDNNLRSEGLEVADAGQVAFLTKVIWNVLRMIPTNLMSRCYR